MPARHEMILTGTGESGAEEWVCPTCGRRMLLRWPPNYQKLILEDGDDAAIHIGGKGGLRASQVAIAPEPAGEAPLVEAPLVETPPGETPPGETPLGETPLGETAAGEVTQADRWWLRANGIDWDGASA